MGKRKADWDLRNQQEIDPEIRIVVQTGDCGLAASQAEHPGSNKHFLGESSTELVEEPPPQVTGVDTLLAEPTVQVPGEGVGDDIQLPSVLTKEGEDDKELHPFWKLLELVGYELM